jgi:acyl-CoA thioesterase
MHQTGAQLTSLPKFTRDTAVQQTGDGQYGAELNDDWNVDGPQGGLITAVVLRAMAAELGDAEQTLRSSTTVFTAPVRSGPVVITASVIRRGRSASQVMGTVRNVDADTGHITLASFGRTRNGFDFTDLEFPESSPPDKCGSFRNHPMRPPFYDQLDCRPAMGHKPWEDYVPTTSEMRFWYRFDEAPRDGDGALDPLALVLMADTMPPAISERMGPHLPAWSSPSLDLTVHLLGDVHSDWVLARNRARHAGDGFASVEIELWDTERKTIAAYATQVCRIMFPPTELPPQGRRPTA